ncbi:hypothetical protein BrevBR_01110 [Brevundimonas sp. BR2-1]|nr:hypothetical protein [Brevundimonas sp. UBA7664]
MPFHSTLVGAPCQGTDLAGLGPARAANPSSIALDDLDRMSVRQPKVE